MKTAKPRVILFPGGSGDTKSRKLTMLAEIAERKHFEVMAVDSTEVPNPEHRVQAFIKSQTRTEGNLIFVGSSMGGYVATVISETISPLGMFLLGPVFYLPPYLNQSPTPKCRHIEVVHGSKDEIVPIENSKRFSKKFGANLHVVDSMHSLEDSLEDVSVLFSSFLDRINEPNRVAGGVNSPGPHTTQHADPH